MKLEELHDKIKSDKAFKKWKKNNKEAVLANVFSSLEEENRLEEMHFGFYTEKDDLLTPFMVSKEGEVKQIRPDKVFKEPQSRIEHVELDRVKIELGDALRKARESVKEKKSAFHEKKAIGILQNKNGKHQWNITLVGNGFDIYNVKIDAENGDVVSSSEVRVFEQIK